MSVKDLPPPLPSQIPAGSKMRIFSTFLLGHTVSPLKHRIGTMVIVQNHIRAQQGSSGTRMEEQ